MVELTLNSVSDPGPRAIMFPRSKPKPHILTEDVAPLPVAPPGRFIYGPNDAVIRTSLVVESVPGGWLLVPEVARISSDSPIGRLFVTSYRMINVLDHNVTTLRRWVKRYRIGQLEVKRRATNIDLAVLQKQLKLGSDGPTALLLTRTVIGARISATKWVG